jgi:hypothetical protein
MRERYVAAARRAYPDGGSRPGRRLTREPRSALSPGATRPSSLLHGARASMGLAECGSAIRGPVESKIGHLFPPCLRDGPVRAIRKCDELRHRPRQAFDDPCVVFDDFRTSLSLSLSAAPLSARSPRASCAPVPAAAPPHAVWLHSWQSESADNCAPAHGRNSIRQRPRRQRSG